MPALIAHDRIFDARREFDIRRRAERALKFAIELALFSIVSTAVLAGVIAIRFLAFVH